MLKKHISIFSLLLGVLILMGAKGKGILLSLPSSLLPAKKTLLFTQIEIIKFKPNQYVTSQKKKERSSILNKSNKETYPTHNKKWMCRK